MKQQQVDMKRFEIIMETAKVMITSQKEFTQDAYTNLVLEAISCGPSSFAESMQEQLMEILVMPPIRHLMEEGIPVHSMEQVARYYNRSDEILNATYNRLAKE